MKCLFLKSITITSHNLKFKKAKISNRNCLNPEALCVEYKKRDCRKNPIPAFFLISHVVKSYSDEPKNNAFIVFRQPLQESTNSGEKSVQSG